MTSTALAIIKLRRRLRMNQTQFARAVGVSQKTVSDWETSKGTRTVMLAIRLARLLK